jgi:hypothetical protein
MAKRPIKLSATDDMDELSDAGPMTTAIENEPIMATPIVSGPPVVRQAAEAPVAPKSNAAPKNVDAQRAEFFDKAKEYGKADGNGKKAFVQFARALVDAGSSGALSPSSKAGDASKAYDAFTSSSTTAAGNVTDEAKASAASQLSKVRAFIRLGHKYEDEAQQAFDRALTVHRDLMSSPATRENVKFRSTYTALYSVAVAQCKPDQNGQLLSEKEIRDMLVSEPVILKDKTAADILIDALNAMERALRGKAATAESNGREPCNHPALPDVIEATRAVITDIDAEALKARDDEIEAMKVKKAEKAKAAAEKKAETEAKKAAKAAEEAAQAQASGVTPESEDDEPTEDASDDDFDPSEEDETVGFGLPAFNLR